jgi:hypothetical protein
MTVFLSISAISHAVLFGSDKISGATGRNLRDSILFSRLFCDGGHESERVLEQNPEHPIGVI